MNSVMELTAETKDQPDRAEILTVEKGQKTAVLLPPTSGKRGKNVFGMEMSATHGRPLTPRIGKHIVFDSKTNTFYAGASGRVVVRENFIDIENILILGKDLASSVGHVKFPGELVVKGWVHNGLLVEGDKDILIEGGVEAAKVFSSEGSVLVRKGIQGGGSGFVWAKWDVSAGFMEQATVLAGGILRTSSATDCDLAAGETVRITDGRGIVMGCRIYAGAGVEVKTISAGKDGPSIVYLGRTPEELLELSRIKRRMQSLQKEIMGAESELNRLLGASDYLESSPPSNGGDHVQKLAKTILVLNTRLQKLKTHETELDETMALRTNGTLDVRGRIYPGVKVVIGGTLYPVKRALSWVRFRYDLVQRRVVAIPLS